MNETYNINIKNCNNIDNADITISKNALNIKYATNGTGKSTIARALDLSLQGQLKLAELTSFKYQESKEKLPSISGNQDIKSIMVFNEQYVNGFVFKDSELLDKSFDILVNNDEYKNGEKAINVLIEEIKKTFRDNVEIDGVIRDLGILVSGFGKSTKNTPYAKSSQIGKALGDGNKLLDIPENLKPYEKLLTSSENVKWLKWQMEGKSFLDVTQDNCPYCTIATTIETKNKIQEITEKFDSKTIEHLNNVLQTFSDLKIYFSQEAIDNIEKITSKTATLSLEENQYLEKVKKDAETLQKKFIALRDVTFFSLKEDDISEKISNMKIQLGMLETLNSIKTKAISDEINNKLDSILKKKTELESAIGKHRAMIKKIIQLNKKDIDLFLLQAGYKYHVEIEEDSNSYKMRLRHIDAANHIIIDNGRNNLSYGERNAFALILFMYEAIKKNPDIIILDDPISSFDKNKKYAILDRIFRGKNSLKDKTVLMLTHDFEPIIDVIYSLHEKFPKSKAYFLSYEDGNIIEKKILRENIQTFSRICKKIVASDAPDIIKAIYLRRHYEINDDKSDVYHFLSSLLHKRDIPTKDNIDFSNDEKNQALTTINNDFQLTLKYEDLLSKIKDDNYMLEQFNTSIINYEKLQLFRIKVGENMKSINLLDCNSNNKGDVIKKFINESFHVENEFIMQLDPREYSLIPSYVIENCASYLNTPI